MSDFIPLQIASIVFGVLIVTYTLTSAIRSFVLPHGDNVALTRFIFSTVNRFFRLRLKRARTYEDRDRVMALFAPTALSFVQWQLQTVLPMALLIASHVLLSNLSWFVGLNAWWALSISGFVGATLFAPLALLIDLWLESTQSDDLLGELAEEWMSVVPPVAICWLALNAPWVLGFRLEKHDHPDLARQSEERSPAPPDRDNGPEPAGFMAMLPPEIQGRLILLKSELHYLRVVTENGSSLILYNLADAIAQLPADSGLSVHRSYWIAFDAVGSLTRRGRQGLLRLCDGSEVPVSRSRLASVSRRLEERQVSPPGFESRTD